MKIKKLLNIIILSVLFLNVLLLVFCFLTHYHQHLIDKVSNKITYAYVHLFKCQDESISIFNSKYYACLFKS